MSDDIRQFKIEIPAIVTGLGSGAGILSMALDLVDCVTAGVLPNADSVTLETVPNHVDPDGHPLICGYRAWFVATGRTPPGIRFAVESHIPDRPELGASIAGFVAGLAAAAFVAKEKHPQNRILNIAAAHTGDPAAAAATVRGGLVTAFRDGSSVQAAQVASHLALGTALFFPDEDERTAEPEAILDPARLSYLVTTFIWGQWERMGKAMPLPCGRHARAIAEAAIAAGAYGVFRVGGGTALLALGPRAGVSDYAEAMTARAHERGAGGRHQITSMREAGVRVVTLPEPHEMEAAPDA